MQISTVDKKKDIVLGKEQGLFVLGRRKNLVPVVQHRSNVVRMVDSLGQPLSTILTLHVEEEGDKGRSIQLLFAIA